MFSGLRHMSEKENQEQKSKSVKVGIKRERVFVHV